MPNDTMTIILSLFWIYAAFLFVSISSGSALDDNDENTKRDDSFSPPDFCLIPPRHDDVTCTGPVSRLWFYDVTTHQCLTYQGRGCTGNKNSFGKERDCYSVCIEDSDADDDSAINRNAFSADDDVIIKSKQQEDISNKQISDSVPYSFDSVSSTIPPLMVEANPSDQSEGSVADSKQTMMIPGSRTGQQMSEIYKEASVKKSVTGLDDIQSVIEKKVSDTRESPILSNLNLERTTLIWNGVESITRVPVMISDLHISQEQKIASASGKPSSDKNQDGTSSYLNQKSSEGYSAKISTDGPTTVSNSVKSKYFTPLVEKIIANTDFFSTTSSPMLKVQTKGVSDEIGVKSSEKVQKDFQDKPQFELLLVNVSDSDLDEQSEKDTKPELTRFSNIGPDTAMLNELPIEMPVVDANRLTFREFIENEDLSDEQHAALNPMNKRRDLPFDKSVHPFRNGSPKFVGSKQKVRERFDDDNDFLYDILPDDESRGRGNSNVFELLRQINKESNHKENSLKNPEYKVFADNENQVIGINKNGEEKSKALSKKIRKEPKARKSKDGESAFIHKVPTDSVTSVIALESMNSKSKETQEAKEFAPGKVVTDSNENSKAEKDPFAKIIRANLRFFRPPPINVRPIENSPWSIQSGASLFPFMTIDPNNFHVSRPIFKKLNADSDHSLKQDQEKQSKFMMVPPAILISPNQPEIDESLNAKINENMNRENVQKPISEFPSSDHISGHRILEDTVPSHFDSREDYGKNINAGRFIGHDMYQIHANSEQANHPQDAKLSQRDFLSPPGRFSDRTYGYPLKSSPDLQSKEAEDSKIEDAKFLKVRDEGTREAGVEMRNNRRIYSIRLSAMYRPVALFGLSRTINMRSVDDDVSRKNFDSENIRNPLNLHARENNADYHPIVGSASYQSSYYPDSEIFRNNIQYDRFPLGINSGFPFEDSNPWNEQIKTRDFEKLHDNKEFQRPRPDFVRASRPSFEDHEHFRSEFANGNRFAKGVPLISARELKGNDMQPHMSNNEFSQDSNSKLSTVNARSDEVDDFDTSSTVSSQTFKAENKENENDSINVDDKRPILSKVRLPKQKKSKKPSAFSISPSNQFTLTQIFINKNDDGPDSSNPGGVRDPFELNPPSLLKGYAYPRATSLFNPVPSSYRPPHGLRTLYEDSRASINDMDAEASTRDASHGSSEEGDRHEDSLIRQSHHSNDPVIAKSHHSTCYQPLHLGHCKSIEIRWYYNAYLGRCEMFQYGGCGGNENRFASYEDCLELCITDNSQSNDPIVSTTINSMNSEKQGTTLLPIADTSSFITTETSEPAKVSSTEPVKELPTLRNDSNDAINTIKIEAEMDNNIDGVAEGIVFSMQYIIMAAVLGCVALVVIILGCCGLAHLCKRRKKKAMAAEELAKENIYGTTNIMYPESVISDEKDSSSIKTYSIEKTEA